MLLSFWDGQKLIGLFFEQMSMLKKLREDIWGKNVPVIILTNLSSADEERNREITKLEPTYYFVKTDKKMEEIVDKIKDRLGMSVS